MKRLFLTLAVLALSFLLVITMVMATSSTMAKVSGKAEIQNDTAQTAQTSLIKAHAFARHMMKLRTDLTRVNRIRPVRTQAKSVDIPQEPLVLLQNYPNPFNPETWMPYRLAQDADVKLRIFDIRGRLIRTMTIGFQQAGLYITKTKAAYWDGIDNFGMKVASGIYFYNLTGKIEDGNRFATPMRKMVILK